MNTFMQNKDLDGNSFQIIRSKNNCVILIHGFTATTVEVRPLANELANAGYSVICPLLPGHNTTPEDLNKIKWHEWVSSVDFVLEKAFNDFDNVFISGESMGGLVACYLAAQYKSIKGVLLFSPALFVPKLQLSKFIRYFRPFMPKAARKKDDVNTEIYPWKGYTVNPTSAANELFKLQKIVKTNLPKIVQPVLIIQGKKDNTITPESSNYIYEHINSIDKKLVIMENSGHCVLLDQDFQLVVEYSKNFLSRLG